MKLSLTPKDWELLSAYLDGQLTDQEKRQMQALLAQRPDMGQGLDELRRTRTVLRSAPLRRAPRNFTLTPAMVHKPQRRLSWAPAFGFASAMATILFVLSFFFQLTPLAAFPAAAPAPAPAQVFSQSLRTGQATAPNAPENNADQATPPAGGLGSGVEESPAPNTASGIQASPPPDVASLQPSTKTPPAALVRPLSVPEATLAPSAAAKSAAPLLAPSETPNTPAAAAPMAAGLPTTNPAYATETGPILGVAPQEDQGQVIVPTQEANDVLASQAGEPVSNWPWVQGGLAAAALACGTVAFWLWRRSRH